MTPGEARHETLLLHTREHRLTSTTPGRHQSLYLHWSQGYQCGFCLRNAANCRTSTQCLVYFSATSLFHISFAFCPAYHNHINNTKQSISTRRGTETTNAKPNFAVSTIIMLRPTYMPSKLAIPYSFYPLYHCAIASRNAFPSQSPPSLRVS